MTSKDTKVCLGQRCMVTVVFFAPCINTLTYLFTWNS